MLVLLFLYRSPFRFKDFVDSETVLIEALSMGQLLDWNQQIFSFLGESALWVFGIGTELLSFLIKSFVFLAMDRKLKFINIH